MKQMYVYIMANRSRTLYVGVTNDIARRVWEHKNMQLDGFTRRYLIDRLVYYELAPDADSAIRREKQIKGWVRRKKISLIESVNPDWRDLSEDFLDIRTNVPPGPFSFPTRGHRDSSLLRAQRRAEASGVKQRTHSSVRGAQNDRNGQPS